MASATVIGTAGLVSYDPCNGDESGNAQRWLMVIVSGLVVTSASFFTFRRLELAALRLVVASGLGLAVVVGLIVLAPGTWVGGCAN
jgi:hypothetical protein